MELMSLTVLRKGNFIAYCEQENNVTFLSRNASQLLFTPWRIWRPAKYIIGTFYMI
jgi:hypothetical protein